MKLDGRLRSDSALGSTDGDRPGLQDIDIAIKGETSFDPFLVGDRPEAKLDTPIPAARRTGATARSAAARRGATPRA